MKKLIILNIFLLSLLSCSFLNENEIKYINRKTGKIEIEKVAGEKWIKFLYKNPLGKVSLNTLIKRKYISEYYGKYMDTPKSKSKIKKFIKDLDIDMKDSEKNVDEFKTFNEFFYRKLKKGSRIIDQNKNSIVSPADGKILVFEKISDVGTLYIKGTKFELNKFVDDEKIAKKYENGSIAIVRLSPSDYHRVHFPYDGQASETNLINGVYYSVSPIAISEIPSIFWENKREISILKTKSPLDDIIIIEVGASMVGGIKQTYIPNEYVKKGDEKSYFYFGGSTVILLFKKNTVKFSKDLINNTKNKLETKVYMGEKIANVID